MTSRLAGWSILRKRPVGVGAGVGVSVGGGVAVGAGVGVNVGAGVGVGVGVGGGRVGAGVGVSVGAMVGAGVDGGGRVGAGVGAGSTRAVIKGHWGAPGSARPHTAINTKTSRRARLAANILWRKVSGCSGQDGQRMD